MLEIVIGRIIQVFFIILRPRPRTYASTSPLLLVQLHQRQQLLSIINIMNSTNHHLQHAKLRILLQHLTSHATYERSGGPPKRPAAKRPCNSRTYYFVLRTVMIRFDLHTGILFFCPKNATKFPDKSIPPSNLPGTW